jgi:hypothetical protein
MKNKKTMLSPRKLKNLKKKISKQRQKETYVFTRKFYKFLKSHSSQIFFRKLYGNQSGNYDYETEDIIVDHRRDFLSTLIHEFLHHIHPDWSETKVLSTERRLINSLTPRQVRNILKKLGKVL